MRKLDFSKPFSEADIAWLRQAGSVLTEEQIALHQEGFGEDVPELEDVEDQVTRSALDPTARRVDRVESDGAAQLIDPTKADPQGDDESSEEPDDYDTWNKTELENEVTARNVIAGGSDGKVTSVEVVGTGANGSVKKEDLIKGLRLWDQENPGALED